MNFVKFNAPDYPALMAYQNDIQYASDQATIPACLLAAIVWRETGGQNEYQIGMPHGPGCGVGLTQITSGVDWSSIDDPTYQGYHLMTPADNLYVAANYFLRGLMKSAEAAKTENPIGFETSCRGQIIYAVAAGYNAGFGAVLDAITRGIDVDTLTTNGYAGDCLQKFITLVDASEAAK